MTTVRTAVLLLVSMAAAVAAAEPPRDAVEAEARGFLDGCWQKYQFQRDLCAADQKDFVDAYVRARQGDPESMRFVAYAFGPHDRGEISLTWIGLPTRPIEACAWRHLHVGIESNSLTRGMEDIACAGLSADDRAAAMNRADVLKAR